MSRFPQLENRGRGTWRVWWGPDEPNFDDYPTRLEAQRAIQDFREYQARQERLAERRRPTRAKVRRRAMPV